MDFFTVPTASFSLLYCFFIIGHDRRRIFHFNLTHYPTSTWIMQQFREAFSLSRQPRFSSSITTPSTARKCPWPFAGTSHLPVLRSAVPGGAVWRWVGSCRRELLDHVICHQSVAPEATAHFLHRLLPSGPHALRTSNANWRQAYALYKKRKVISFSRIGGQHHRYLRAA